MNLKNFEPSPTSKGEEMKQIKSELNENEVSLEEKDAIHIIEQRIVGEQFQKKFFEKVEELNTKVDSYLKNKEALDSLIKQWNMTPDGQRKHVHHSHLMELRKGVSVSVPVMDTWMNETSFTSKEQHDHYCDLVRKASVYAEANSLDCINRYIQDVYLNMLKQGGIEDHKWFSGLIPLPADGEELEYPEQQEMKLPREFFIDMCQKFGYDVPDTFEK